MSAPFNEFGPFAVGEVCVFQKAEIYQLMNGRECVIEEANVGVFSSRTFIQSIGYRVKFADGFTGCATDEQLRRKRPPSADTAERTFMADIRKLADKAPQRVGETA